jgi:hypothetical protein
MEPFITFRDTNNKGELKYYILQRDYPHYCGRIDELPDPDAIFQSPVAKYYLWVTFSGTIRGNYVPGYKDAFEEMQHVFTHMAAWYFENRIMTRPKKFKKWAVPASLSQK